MSTEALLQADTNAEAAFIATEDAAVTRREVLLWQKPTLRDSEIPDALGIPSSLWQECKRAGDTPPLFQIGRRLFCRTEDLRKWLDAKARAGAPGSKPLRARAQREAA